MKREDTYLQKILAHKEKEVAARKLKLPQRELEKRIETVSKPRAFKEALATKVKEKEPAVIAEIKFASPSAGLIRDDKNVGAIAKSYEESGAACLSVLTDERFFQGQDQYLLEAKEQVALPVLRKDFIIDEYQIWESRLLSADCILLIAAALTDEQLTLFYRLAFQLQLDVLIEVHDMDEFKLALQFKNAILGVNNRNLKSFEVDLTLSHQLQRKLPRGRWLVTESGIRERDDVLKMQEKGIYAFLVGSSLMSAELPGVALKALFYP